MSFRLSVNLKFSKASKKHPDDIEQPDEHGTSVSGFLLLIGRGYQKKIHIKFLAESKFYHISVEI